MDKSKHKVKYPCYSHVVCQICGREGLLQQISPRYYRIRHYSHLDQNSRKPMFVYHVQKDIEKVRELLKVRSDQVDLKNKKIHDPINLKSPLINENMRAGRLAWLGRCPYEHCNNDIVIDPTSNLTFNINEFKTYLDQKYSKTSIPPIMCYVRKHYQLLNGDLRQLEMLSPSVKASAIKALIILSKYLGIYEQFKSRLKDYGIKIARPNGFSSFLRILNASNSDVLKWYSDSLKILRPNEQLYLKLCLMTGVREAEAVMCFNKIIQLSKDRLNEYYDNLPESNVRVLCHFKYPKEFIRKTKNVFISMVPEELINQIVDSESVSYQGLAKRLRRAGLKLRINELRDFYGTYLRRHNILSEEVDLLQGRIPMNIFVRHYWSPKLSELKDRVLSALELLEQEHMQ